MKQIQDCDDIARKCPLCCMSWHEECSLRVSSLAETYGCMEMFPTDWNGQQVCDQYKAMIGQVAQHLGDLREGLCKMCAARIPRRRLRAKQSP